MLVHGVEPVRDQPAVLGDDGVGTDLVVGRVQVGDARGDLHALGVDPRAGTDAVLGIDGGRAAHGLGAEIGAPGLGSGAGLGGQRLAMTISPFETAIVGALRTADAGDEERHVGKLRRLRRRCRRRRLSLRPADERHAGDDHGESAGTNCLLHPHLPVRSPAFCGHGGMTPSHIRVRLMPPVACSPRCSTTAGIVGRERGIKL